MEKPWTASKNSKNGTAHSFVHRAWETGERTPVSHERRQAGGAPSQSVRSVSVFPNERNVQSTVSRWRHNQPVHSIGAGSVERLTGPAGSRLVRAQARPSTASARP